MGWLFSTSWNSKTALIKHLQSPDRYGKNLRLASRVVGMHHWYVVQTPSGARVIGLDLMQSGCRHSPAWGYKDLDETVCPCAVDCPRSLLELASEPTSDLAATWRRQVVDHHESVSRQRAEKKKLAPGSNLVFQGVQYRLVLPAGIRMGWYVERVGDGKAFRMSDRQVTRAMASGS